MCNLFNIQHYSVHDGPGIRTTVFLKGCPLRCQWCSNPESISPAPAVFYRRNLCNGCGTCVEVCPNKAIRPDADFGCLTDQASCKLCGKCVDECMADARTITGRTATVEEILAEAKKDAPFYRISGGGVTLSGGEPLVQSDVAAELLRRLSDSMIHTAVETTGHVKWESIERCLPHLDLVIFDIKHMNPERHRELTGVDNVLIQENLLRLGKTGAKVWIRVPVVPSCNDDEYNLQCIAEMANQVKGLELIELLPYHPYGSGKYACIGQKYSLAHILQPTEDQMARLREIISGRVSAPVK